MHIISNKEYNDFVDNNQVSDERIKSIAKKIIEAIDLSLREESIFKGKTKEINSFIVKYNNRKKS